MRGKPFTKDRRPRSPARCRRLFPVNAEELPFRCPDAGSMNSTDGRRTPGSFTCDRGPLWLDRGSDGTSPGPSNRHRPVVGR